MSMLFNIYGENSFEDKYKSFPKLVLLTLTYSLSYFYIAYTLAYFTTYGATFLTIKYGIAMVGFFRVLYMAVVAFGAGFGTLASKFLVDKYPKRQFIIILNGFALLFGALILWIQDIYLILIIRFCQGLCIGFYYIVIPTVLKQISPPKILNRVIAVNYSIFSFALVLLYTFAYKLSSVYVLNRSAGMGWTIICAFPLAILAIQTVLLEFKFPFETTIYYIKNNKFIDAQKALDHFYKKWQVIDIIKKTEQKIKQKQKRREVDIENNIEDEQVDFRNKGYNASNPLLPQRQINFQRRKSKYNLMAAFAVVFLQQFSGINAFIPYAFWFCYNAAPEKFYLPLIMFLIMMISAQAMPTLIEKINRKTIIMISTIVCAISCSLISYGLYYNEDLKNIFWTKNSGFIISGLVLMMLNHGSSLGPIFDVYLDEIVPSNFQFIVKAISWGAAGFAVMGCSTDWRSSVMFLIFSIWSILSIFANYKLQIETNAKTKNQIEEEYQRMVTYP